MTEQGVVALRKEGGWFTGRGSLHPSHNPPVPGQCLRRKCPECPLPSPASPPGSPLSLPGLHSPPQTFMDAGGITSSFALGERRAGVKVAHQRGPGPGTALAHRVTGAG